MTAPRTCRRCGAELPRDIRWCTRCFEPVRELSARGPLHRGDFVGSPIHERGDIPRWTHWEKTATTFGPWGRIVATALVFATLIPAIAFNGFVYTIVFPFVAVVLLREIWAKGWYVPESESAEDEDVHREPRRPAPIDPEPITARSLIRWGLILGGTVAFTYGNVGIKAAVAMFALAALLVWLWAKVDR